MAFTMQIESARLAPCGDIVQITWRSPTSFPGNWGTPDWKEGHRAGRWFDVAGRTKVQHVSTTPFVAANNTVEWQTFLYVPQPIVFGTASAALSVDAGLLTDKYGNSNAGVSSFPIDVSATLVDATGFIDPAVTPPPGVPTLYIDPVNGSDSRTFNQAKAAGAVTPVKTFKKASDLAIANGFQGAGVHFRYLQGQAETRAHTDPYNVIQTWGPSPSKPCIIAPCALDGTAPTARAVIRLSNSGVADAELYGFVREGGGSNPADTPNVAIMGFDIKVTDQSGSSIGSAFKILNGATNLTISDCITERSLVGFDVQAKTPNICIHRNVILDTVGVPKVGSSRRPFGIYTNYCPKGLILNGNIFDRNGKTSTALDRGDSQYRDIYSNKDPNGAIPAGPVCLVNHFHLRGADTTVQLRNGAGAGVVWDSCAGAGFSGGNGGAGWNTTAFLNGVDFVATDGSTVPGNQGPTINNSIRDNLNALSNSECSAGGIVEANVMLKAKAGASLTNARAPGVVGSNWTTKHDYIDRNNTAIGAASWLNSEDGFFFGGLRRENNVVDMRGTGKVNAIFTQLDYTGKATWFSAAGNAFFSDTPSQIALINTTPSSIAAYQTMMGTDNPVVGTAPTFVEATRSLGSWAAANGQTGTDAAFYALARARAFRSSPAYLNAWEAAKYFAAGAVASNYAALGTGWLDKTGVVVGLPSARANGAYGLGTGNAVVLVATISSATIAANGTSLTLNFTGNVANGSSFSGGLSITGVTGSINLAGLVPVVTTNSATIDFSSRGKVRSGQTVTVSVDVGSFTNTAATIAVPAYSGTATNNSTQTTVTRPNVSSVSCTATTVAFVFDENIATAPALTGALTAGSRTISLDGLSRSISTNTLTLDFTANGIVYKGETVTARLDAEAVSSSANGGLSNAFNGPLTNTSGVTVAESLTSFQIGPIAEGLFNPTENRAAQIKGDSIMNPNVGGANTNITTQWNLICGWVTLMGFPLNGLTVSAGGSAAYCGGYANTGTVSSDNTRFPGDGFTEGTLSPNIPLMCRDVKLNPALTNQAAISFNLNKDVLLSARSTPINRSITPCTQKVILYRTSRTYQNINGLAGKNSADVQTFFSNAGQPTGTFQLLDITGGSPIVRNADENPKCSVGYSGSLPVLNTTDILVCAGAEFKWPSLGYGVHMNAPHCKGGVTAADHASETTLYSTAALTNLYTNSQTPTDVVIQVGQNLSALESTQLNAGNPTEFQNNVQLMINKEKTAVAAANVAKSVTNPPTLRFLLIVPYRTGYNPIVYKTIATAMHNICLLDANVGFINLYLLSPLNTNDTLWATLGSGGQTWTTYTCDGVHPNNAGMLYFTSVLRAEMLAKMRKNAATPAAGFQWTDILPFDQAAATMTQDYTISGGTVAIVSGKAEFQAPSEFYKSKRGSDWIGADGFVQCTYDSVTGTLPPSPWGFQSLYLVGRKDGAEGYFAKIDITTNAPTTFGRLLPSNSGMEVVYSGPTNIGTLVQGDVLRLEITGTGPTFTLKKNGSTVMSFTASDSAPIVNGGWTWKSYAATSTLKLTNLSCGVLTPYAAPASVTPTKPWFSKLVLNYDSNKGNAVGQSTDRVWLGSWETLFSYRVDRFIQNGGEGIWIRGEGGNNTQVNNSGRSWSSTTPNSPSIIQGANMLSLHGAGYLRLGSNYATPPSDGRLANDFQTTVAKRRPYLKRVHSYIPLPPNGRSHSDTPGSALAWPNSNAAFDFYFLYVRNLGMTPAFDFAGSLDPLHADSLVAKAALDRAATYDANRRPILEAHTRTFVGYSGGTFANNKAMAISGTFDFASPESQYNAIFTNPTDWYAPAGSTVIFDANAGTPEQRIAKFLLARDRGYNVVGETDDFTPEQEKYIIDTFKQDGFTAGSGNQNTGRFLSVLI